MFRCEPVNIAGAFTHEPPPMDFLLDGFLAGTVGVLTAPGGSGKSFFALALCASVACDAEGGNLLGLNVQKHGPTLYLSAEDPELVLWHRLHALGAFLSPAARSAVATKMTVQSLVGERFDLGNPQHLGWLHGVCGRKMMRLAVIDTLARCHRREENSNEQMGELLTGLEHLAVETGTGILLVHHTNKGEGMVDQAMAARGASALIHNARWCGFLARPSKSETEQGYDAARHVKFGVSKQNYAPPIPDRWYERGNGGVLVPVKTTGTPSADEADRQHKTRRKL